ncbi:MAG: 50S ribosomal protein L24 [Candidatus Nephrothrix sp. EaCA]|nr:MAG: 50S ribosomal protein L24 [Candidatus Nephrothrix sp. EaCA]
MERKHNKIPKLHLRQGDKVKVLSGNGRGKTGVVLEVFTQTNKAVVEGVNLVTKHKKPSAGKPEGSRFQMEAPVHVSNLMVVNPANGEPTRTGRKRNEKGKWQRYAKKTGEFIK